MNDVRLKKTALREHLRVKASSANYADDAFERAPLNDFLAKQSGIWGAFYPFKSEPPILGVLEKASHITWVFPRLWDEGMSFHRCAVDELEKSGMGLREPPASAPIVEPSTMRGAIIPGIAFDRRGGRLGRGRGHYDRFLESLKGMKVGAIWNYGLVNEVPLEQHDMKVDAVATESEFVLVAQAHV